MSGANHVVGGAVFTGIFCSFWNLNIFEKPQYLFFTVFFAILPDIDHTKSPIGKLFYPIAKYLYIKFGHRTITHSLLFYACLFLIVATLDSVANANGNYTLIYAFAFFSHLLFDMVTKQGIPLFWPFMRNPCVIPGNPELRFKSSHLQTEAVIFSIFILLGITCQPLFSQGFWTSFNKTFNDIKHLHQEARQNENALLVKYSFTSNSATHEGTGILINSTETNATIFNNSKFIHISNTDKIKNLSPTKTNSTLHFSELFFFNISPDSLKSLLKSKPIIELKIQSSSQFSYIKENKPTIAKSAEIQHVFNPIISFLPDSITSNLFNRMELLKYDLQKANNEARKIALEKSRLEDGINSITLSLNKMDIYTREKSVETLKKLKSDLSNLSNSNYSETNKISLQINQIQNKINASKSILISGYIKYLAL